MYNIQTEYNQTIHHFKVTATGILSKTQSLFTQSKSRGQVKGEDIQGNGEVGLFPPSEMLLEHVQYRTVNTNRYFSFSDVVKMMCCIVATAFECCHCGNSTIQSAWCFHLDRHCIINMEFITRIQILQICSYSTSNAKCSVL